MPQGQQTLRNNITFLRKRYLSRCNFLKMLIQWFFYIILNYRKQTRKGLFFAISILGKNLQQIFPLLHIAKELGCVAAVIPTIGNGEADTADFFIELDAQTPLPIVIYNTEDSPIGTLKTLMRLDQLDNIVAIKDSSCREGFFAELLLQKQVG